MTPENKRALPVAQFVCDLETIFTLNPKEIRGQALRAISEAVGSDSAFFFGLAELNGKPIASQYQVLGSADAQAAAKAAYNSRELGPQQIRAILDPDPRELRSFLEDQAITPRHIFEETDIYRKFFYPYKFKYRQALRIYHGQRYIGIVGLGRQVGAPPFNANTRRRLMPLVQPTLRLFTAADILARRHCPEGPAYLFVSPRGEVEHASCAAKLWLTKEGLQEELARLIQAMDRGQEASRSDILQLAEARVVRMDGAAGGVNYLVTLLPAKSLRRPPDALLSPTQRKIASYAVAGATYAEIARATSCRINTIRTHIREIYSRLGVSSRLELATRLRALPPLGQARLAVLSTGS